MLQFMPECRTLTDKAAMKKAITCLEMWHFVSNLYIMLVQCAAFPMELPYTTKTENACVEYFLAILWSRLHNVRDII